MESRKRDYVWNTLAGLINAAEAVVMSMIVTRITNLQDAGILTIGFAIGNTMMTVGKFGVRNYQVTDAEHKYSFKDYFGFRLFTILAMIVASVIYLVYCVDQNGYSSEKVLAIGAIIFIYIVETLEDVIWGEYQLKGYLAEGAQLFCIRWISIFIVFTIIMIIYKNMALALVFSGGASLVIFCLVVSVSSIRLFGENILFQGMGSKIHQLLKIVWAVIPLFLVSFLTFYINNAPKYSIDKLMSEEIQACYGFVAMPVFVIGLLNNFIYQPTLVKMSQEWCAGEYNWIKKRVIKQIAILAAVTCVVICGAYILGIPVLSILYATDLRAYKSELIILLIGGGFLALSGYLSVVLTIMRYQKDLLVGYLLVAFASLLLMDYCVMIKGTMGAAWTYMILMIGLSLVYGINFWIRMQKVVKQQSGEK